MLTQTVPLCIHYVGESNIPAVVHDGPEQVVYFRRAPFKAVVHVHVVLVVVLQHLHDVLEV